MYLVQFLLKSKTNYMFLCISRVYWYSSESQEMEEERSAKMLKLKECCEVWGLLTESRWLRPFLGNQQNHEEYRTGLWWNSFIIQTNTGKERWQERIGRKVSKCPGGIFVSLKGEESKQRKRSSGCLSIQPGRTGWECADAK